MSSRRPPSGSEETLEDILDAPTRSDPAVHDEAPTDINLGPKLRAARAPSAVDPFAETNEGGMRVAEVHALIEQTRDPDITARRLIAPNLPTAEPASKPSAPVSPVHEPRPVPDHNRGEISPPDPRTEPDRRAPKTGQKLRLIFALNVVVLVIAVFIAAWFLKDRDGKLEQTPVAGQR